MLSCVGFVRLVQRRIEMKRIVFVLATAVALGMSGAVQGQIVVPGADGSDGALTVTANTVVDMSTPQTPAGAWNGPNTSPGHGVYDPNMWAVVFRYSSVTINSGAT